MSGRNRQIIAVMLIVAFWMPVVTLPTSVNASNTNVVTGTPTSTASLFGLFWAKLATPIPAAVQEDETTPPGMPTLKPTRWQHNYGADSAQKAGGRGKPPRLGVSPVQAYFTEL